MEAFNCGTDWCRKSCQQRAFVRENFKIPRFREWTDLRENHTQSTRRLPFNRNMINNSTMLRNKSRFGHQPNETLQRRHKNPNQASRSVDEFRVKITAETSSSESQQTTPTALDAQRTFGYRDSQKGTCRAENLVRSQSRFVSWLRWSAYTGSNIEMKQIPSP